MRILCLSLTKCVSRSRNGVNTHTHTHSLVSLSFIFSCTHIAHITLTHTHTLSHHTNTPHTRTQSKLLAEQSVLKATKTAGLLACAIRPHSMFGPGDPYLVPALAKAAQKGKSKFQMGNGTNLVDFTYIANVAYAHLLAASKLMDKKSNVNGQVWVMIMLSLIILIFH